MTEAEGWAALMVDNLKRWPDADLLADLEYSRREVAELVEASDQSFYLGVMRVKIARMETELARRQGLVAFGGPAVRSLPSIQERVDRVKAAIDILAVADLVGLRYIGHPTGRTVRYACPVHGDGNDRNPSGILNLDRNTWHCFGCAAGGSVFDLLIARRVVPTFLQALDWLEAHCGIVRPPQQPHKPGRGHKGIVPL